MPTTNDGPLLECRNLVRHYNVGGGFLRPAQSVHALDGIDLSLEKGRTLAIVGESGCGKSTLARCLMRLDQPTSGEIVLDGRDISTISGNALRKLRRRVQIVFQDPYSSLNGRRTIYQSIADPIRIHGIVRPAERRAAVTALLDTVGLSEEFLHRYPHELSGGQRQRVAIARALSVDPSVVICDEPVSALDVSIQAQVINLLKRLQIERGISYIFISHDLSVVMHVADEIAVMYLGQVVERGKRSEIARGVLHPYSQALFSAAPIADPDAASRNRIVLKGELPTPLDPPPGCRFQGRCPHRRERCIQEAPALRDVGDRQVRCHFTEEIGPMARS